MALKNYAKQKFELINGLEIPAIGIDTSCVQSYEEVCAMVDTALSFGYKLFNAVSDVRAGLKNEKYLGTALRELLPIYRLERDDIFISINLNGKYSIKPKNSAQFVEKAFANSLSELQMDHIDMYTISFPEEDLTETVYPHHSEIRVASWNALSALYDDGNITSIGVKDFTGVQLSNLIANHCSPPMLNKVPFHPLCPQEDLLSYCNSQFIKLQSSSVFGGLSKGLKHLIEHSVVKKIACEHNVNTTQVLLAWALAREVAVMPKATKPEHMRDNIELTFQLTHQNMLALNNIRMPPRNLRRLMFR